MPRLLAAYALLIVALAAFLFAAEVPLKLVGRWRSLETSEGGIGAILEFHADGSVDFSPGAVVEARYRIEGNQLILASDNKAGPEQRMTIEFIGEDKVHFRSVDSNAAEPKSMELVRRGARTDPLNLLIGEWNGTRDIGRHEVETRWLFYSTGKSLLLMPFYVDHGHFTVDGANIRFDLPREKLPEGHFDIDDDVLKLPGRKTLSRYARY
jgi:hypothetical protein